MNAQNEMMIPDELIMSRILNIRGLNVMIDADLADLYGVTTKRLNEQVRRNSRRFPEDFMFQLTADEKREVVANCDHLKRLKYSPTLPHAFTEHGAVMLASVLNSEKAISVNIQIIRIFNKMRKFSQGLADIYNKLTELEKSDKEQSEQILLILQYIGQLEQSRHQQEQQAGRKKIGFRKDVP